MKKIITLALFAALADWTPQAHAVESLFDESLPVPPITYIDACTGKTRAFGYQEAKTWKQEEVEGVLREAVHSKVMLARISPELRDDYVRDATEKARLITGAFRGERKAIAISQFPAGSGLDDMASAAAEIARHNQKIGRKIAAFEAFIRDLNSEQTPKFSVHCWGAKAERL